MVKAFPIAGSVYNYASRGIAPPVGFLAGWAALLDYFLVPGLLYLIASVAMHAILPVVPAVGWLILFVLANTVVNLFGIRMTAGFTALMLVGELVVLVLFVGVGIWALAHGKGHGFNVSPLESSPYNQVAYQPRCKDRVVAQDPILLPTANSVYISL